MPGKLRHDEHVLRDTTRQANASRPDLNDARIPLLADTEERTFGEAEGAQERVRLDVSVHVVKSRGGADVEVGELNGSRRERSRNAIHG